MSSTEAQSAPPKREHVKRLTVAERVTRWIDNRLTRAGLPSNAELERETLCAIMLGDVKYTGIMFSLLESADFASPVYREIYDALLNGWETGVPFNTPATLVQWVRDYGLVQRLRKMLGESTLGVEDLLIVMQANGLAIHAEYYARSLRKLRAQREIWLLLSEAVRDAQESEPAKWLDLYSRKLEELKALCG